MTLRIEIRDPRIGRLSIRAGTSNPKERDRRRASLLQLVETERGRAILDRLRSRKVTVEEVVRAVQSFDLASVEGDPHAPENNPAGVGLAATADAWLRYLEGADRSPKTLELYRTIVRSLEGAMGVERTKRGRVVRDRDMSTITRSEGESWLTGDKPVTGAPWAPGSQRVAHSVAAQLWDRAITTAEEMAERDGRPARLTSNFWRREGARKGVRGARVRRTRFEFLRRGEAARVLWTARRKPYAAWIATGIYAGLRGGEAANLRRGVDVDMEAGTITIQARSGEHAWRPKTDNSQRVIPMHPRLVRWLSAHVRHDYAGEVYFFTAAGRDQPLGRGEWRLWTKQAFEEAGIAYGRRKDALVTHSLRHSFASWLTQADVHPVKIAKLMGDTVEMVIGTYAHLIDENLGEAIRRL